MVDWKYLSGYFDADGNIHVFLNHKRISYGVQFRIYSTNKKVLEKIKEFTGVGKIYKPLRKEENRNICFVYTIWKKLEVKYVLKKISPNLIVKKQQVDYLLKNFNFGYNANNKFNLSKFRESITRKNQHKRRKYI